MDGVPEVGCADRNLVAVAPTETVPLVVRGSWNHDPAVSGFDEVGTRSGVPREAFIFSVKALNVIESKVVLEKRMRILNCRILPAIMQAPLINVQPMHITKKEQSIECGPAAFACMCS